MSIIDKFLDVMRLNDDDYEFDNEDYDYDEEEDYEDASELAALAMAVEATADEYMTIKVVGVKKGSSKTVLNEDSYMCYYSCSRREY